MASARPAAPSFEGRPLPYPHEPAFDQGLVFDVGTLLDRRSVLKLFAYGGVATTLAACGADSATAAPEGTPLSSAASTPATSNPAACATIPEETAGPFPGDGSNGPDLLAESGVVRSDIRSSFGASTTVGQGVPLTIRIEVQ